MKTSRLLPDPAGDLTAALANLPDLLQELVPLKPKHRRLLPRQVAELSALLTVEREDLPPDYMTRPPFLAAYLHHFLPWNLLRQGRLLQGLGPALALPDAARILEVGAGPLTFALALWLARPDLRGHRLHYTGLDRAEAALKAGRNLLARIAPETPWIVRTERGDVRASRARGGPVDLLVLANVLNEMLLVRGKREGRRLDPQERCRQWLEDWLRLVGPKGRVLVIEPGVRASGRMLTGLRQAAVEAGWRVQAPCPHAGECPQPGSGRGPWCHFAVPATGAPSWLHELDAAAELPKQRLSLSFLLLRRPDAGAEPVQDPGTGSAKRMPVRIMSDVLSLPGGRRGVYGCSGRGLVLLELGPGGAPRQGDLLLVQPGGRPRHDRKSGALVISAPDASV